MQDLTTGSPIRLLLLMLAAHYEKLNRLASKFFKGDSTVRSQILAREFSWESCQAATPSELNLARAAVAIEELYLVALGEYEQLKKSEATPAELQAWALRLLENYKDAGFAAALGFILFLLHHKPLTPAPDGPVAVALALPKQAPVIRLFRPPVASRATAMRIAL